jgi:hypothetical protein
MSILWGLNGSIDVLLQPASIKANIVRNIFICRGAIRPSGPVIRQYALLIS